MAFRTEEIITFKTIVICDGCKKETTIAETSSPIGFDSRMNGALSQWYTFENVGGNFMNFCGSCAAKRKEEQTVCDHCDGTGEIWFEDGDEIKGGRCPFCNRIEENTP